MNHNYTFPLNHAYIFPEVLCTRTAIQTTVRKQHTDGKWYLNTVTESVSSGASDDDYDAAVKRFHFQVYWFLISGIINPDVTDELGQPMMPLDEDQRDEKERLQSLLS